MKRNSNMMQRLLAFALVLTMILGYVPVSVSAETETGTAAPLKATLTGQQTGGGDPVETFPDESVGSEEMPTEEGGSDESGDVRTPETNPLRYTYTIVVTDAEGNDVTAAANITWSDGATGAVSNETEETLVSATIVYNGLKLTVDTIESTVEWTYESVTWVESIMATTEITVPTIVLGGHSGFENDPVWTITDAGAQTVAAGDVAKLSMGELTAVATVAGQEYKATAPIKAVPVNVTGVAPQVGWYEALPAEVTVHGDNDATLEDSEKTITINGTEYTWVENGDTYSVTFVPVEGENLVGGNSFSWNSDAVVPTISIASAYEAFVDGVEKTVVAYSYNVGPSGGTVTVNGENATVVAGNGAGSATLDGHLSSVEVKIQNNLNAPKSATATSGVSVYPNMTFSGQLSGNSSHIYVANNTVLTFEVHNASGAISWAVNGVAVPNVTGTTLEVGVTDLDLTRSNTIIGYDNLGRPSAVTINTIELDQEAPVIQITPADPDETPYTDKYYYAAERIYNIRVTDNAKLGECTAVATVNGSEVQVTLVNGEGSLTLEDGQTLTAITVTANDYNNNPNTATYQTNVCVDMTDPVITGTISIAYDDGTTGTISDLYYQNGKTYLILDSGAHNETEEGARKVTVTAVYTLKEANPDAATAAAWGADNTFIQSWTVEKDMVTELPLMVSAKDLAGRVPAEANIGLGQHIVLNKGENGTYTMTVIVDRRTPEDIQNDPLTSAPIVNLGITGNHYTHEGIRYFNSAFDFDMNIKDGDSGIQDDPDDSALKANILVTASGSGVGPASQNVRPDENGSAKVRMTIASGYEYIDGNVNLKIYDNVGNYYYYNENFAVDSLAPRVIVKLDSASAKKTANNVDFYNSDVTLSFTLRDILPCDATIRYSINDVEQAPLILTNNGATAQITITEGQRLTDLKVETEDALGNSTENFSNLTFGNAIEVDGTSAAVTVAVDAGEAAATVDGVNYYSNPVTVTVHVTDKNITAGNGKATLVYAIDGQETTVDLLEEEEYKYTFKVENNTVLTALSVQVVDDAGNVTETMDGVVSSSTDGTVSYVGNQLAVDQTAPVVTVTKNLVDAAYVHTHDNVAYYKDGTVQYIVTITDAFLNPASFVKFNGAGEATYTQGSGAFSAEDRMELSFTVDDSVTLEDLVISSLDMIGLTAAEAVVTDPLTEKDTTFTQGGNQLSYSGPDVIVDSVAPKASVTLTGNNIKTLFERDGVYYVQFQEPEKTTLDMLKYFFGGETETVELTITVEDQNLTLDNTQQEKTAVTSNTDTQWTMENGCATYTDGVTVALHDAELFIIDVAAYDLAGHPMTLSAIQIINNDGTAFEGNVIPIDVEGEWNTTISVDRRAPSTEDSEIPEIKLTDNAGDNKLEGNPDFYKSAFEFVLSVKDAMGEDELAKHAGLKSVGWTFEDANGIVSVAPYTEKNFSSNPNAYSKNIRVNGPHTPGETDSATLSIEAVDNVGNSVYYSKTFGFDNLAPRVAVEMKTQSGDDVLTVENVDFYNQPVTLSFSMVDMLPCEATVNYTIDGVENSLVLTNSGAAAELTITEGQRLTALSVVAADALKNTATAFTNFELKKPIEVDGTPAAVTVAIETKDGVEGVEADGVIYYNNAIDVKVIVTDKNIVLGKTKGYAILTYVINGVEEKVDLLKQEGYTYSIPVSYDDILTGIKIEAADINGNVTTTVDSAMEFDGVTYDGLPLAVDNTPPVVTVTKELGKNAEYVHNFNNTLYYADGEVTYTVVVKDVFLDVEHTSVSFNNKEITGEISDDGQEMTWKFNVTDKTSLSDIQINAIDLKGQYPSADSVIIHDSEDSSSINGNKLTFEQAGEVLKYTGPKVVVDTVAPTAMVQLFGNVEALVEQDGVYYVKVKTPADIGLEGITGAKAETVKLVLTVEDKNMTLEETEQDNTNVFSKTATKWKKVNSKKFQYTDSVKVNLHDTAYFVVDLGAYDLTGHPVTLDTIVLEDNGKLEVDITNDEPGVWQTKFSLDRRTPSTSDDAIPVISLTDTAEKSEKLVRDGMPDLYASDFDFNLFVKDAMGEDESAKHAGLKSVGWTFADANGIVSVKPHTERFNEYKSEYSEPISVSGVGETDNAVLEITAVDNVDNSIHYAKHFAFDNQAPRVTVKFTGTALRKNADGSPSKYYNTERTATVIVEDLHLPDLASFDRYIQVTTQGAASGWKQEDAAGTKYSNVYTFTADGEYTFSVDSVKDIMGNETTTVGYEGENPRDFVVDQTKPVIHVNFAPGTPSGHDDLGVRYYAQNVTAAVTIRELNFNAADVIANFTNSTVRLANWTADLDHKASVTFTQGNNYSFNINFTDLAGNKAEVYQSPKFSVDTTAPTIEITKGNMKTGQLNIVPNDLSLALTINDKQHNLSEYKVTVTHSDNNFQKSVVTGANYYTTTTTEARTTIVIDFSKIAEEKQFDGLYTVEVSARDYAGNIVNLTPELVFSLNRFGSTYTTDDAFTMEFLTCRPDGNVYHKGIDEKLVIKEINPNQVWQNDQKEESGSTITVVVNGTSTVLEKGRDYKQFVTEEGNGDSKWYAYTYEINPKAFERNGDMVEGRYAILLYGVDEAGNKNTNEANESGKIQKTAEGDYTGKIEFILDSTAPIITTTGIESRKNYNAEAQQLKIFLSDNTPAGITVYLNDEEIKLSTEEIAQMSAWLVYDEEAGCYMLNVPEQNTLFAGQNIRVVVVDAAGNEAEYEIKDFSVSTNFFVRILNSGWFLASIAALLLAVYGFLVIRKKKQNTANV